MTCTLTSTSRLVRRNSRVGHRRGGTHRDRRNQLVAGLRPGRVQSHVQRHPSVRRQQPDRQPSQVYTH